VQNTSGLNDMKDSSLAFSSRPKFLIKTGRSGGDLSFAPGHRSYDRRSCHVASGYSTNLGLDQCAPTVDAGLNVEGCLRAHLNSRRCSFVRWVSGAYYCPAIYPAFARSSR
jgi:hypothetical protein